MKKRSNHLLSLGLLSLSLMNLTPNTVLADTTDQEIADAFRAIGINVRFDNSEAQDSSEEDSEHTFVGIVQGSTLEEIEAEEITQETPAVTTGELVFVNGLVPLREVEIPAIEGEQSLTEISNYAARFENRRNRSQRARNERNSEYAAKLISVRNQRVLIQGIIASAAIYKEQGLLATESIDKTKSNEEISSALFKITQAEIYLQLLSNRLPGMISTLKSDLDFLESHQRGIVSRLKTQASITVAATRTYLEEVSDIDVTVTEGLSQVADQRDNVAQLIIDTPANTQIVESDMVYRNDVQAAIRDKGPDHVVGETIVDGSLPLAANASEQQLIKWAEWDIANRQYQEALARFRGQPLETPAPSYDITFEFDREAIASVLSEVLKDRNNAECSEIALNDLIGSLPHIAISVPRVAALISEASTTGNTDAIMNLLVTALSNIDPINESSHEELINISPLRVENGQMTLCHTISSKALIDSFEALIAE